MAEELQVDFFLEEHELPDLLKGIEWQQLYVGVSCISIIAWRVRSAALR